MIVDDRLETVLRTVAAGPGALATQMRQLLDLLGRTPAKRWTERHMAALTRLDSLIQMLGEQSSASLIAASALRSPILVEHFAEAGPKVALAAMTAARLQDREWLQLIPDLPVQARGFLRHRRDLGPDVEGLLARLGITDFALPLPPGFEQQAEPESRIVPLPQIGTAAPTSDGTAIPAGEGIGAIIARIEAFRRAREPAAAGTGAALPSGQTRLPFADEVAAAQPAITAVDIALDAEGTVIAAGTGHAAALVGLRPFATDPDAPVTCDPATLGAARARLPVIGGKLELEGPGPLEGAWRIDAVPDFVPDTGHFLGWHARLRRPPVPPAADLAAASEDAARRSTDRLRQMLHELRTPINAIQGFAELIQQQLLGPTPHQYRSLAAGIASDAARMLAGFEDVERLAMLETAAPDADVRAGGETDLTALLTRLIDQLDPLLAPREVAFTHDLPDGPLPVAVPYEELERTLWRLLSLVASAAAPGERLALSLSVGAGPSGYAVRLILPLPTTLAARDDSASLLVTDSLASPGGMLGSGFALRLCTAEVRAAGGLMLREDGRVVVNLPLLTSARDAPSQRGIVGSHTG
ncbi:histidine kinase dimerization/phospho-acceptor domain-containing protein [Novosphingobium sp. NDB2Meth1]|uniref:histidine kinase dimerization/phospho-acceptor domain-containing protein n=1 Tax=Novosphingobium sp. NDB2Meth1 TaxID=1892847 RepID=UPI000930EC5E|nr:histidine kinase dimerization/phospho-acceptor domain-containing protein [Novosphingobium sp. NDB2Meth1]